MVAYLGEPVLIQRGGPARLLAWLARGGNEYSDAVMGFQFP
jgi:hypothetical protein